MTRKDFQNLKTYLAETLLFYHDLSETVNLVVQNEISADEYYQMHRSFEVNFPNQNTSNDFKNLYMVAHDYLQLEYPDFCKLLLSTRNQD